MKQLKTQKPVYHFKRWTRKSYAVFASLGKIIRISTLSVALTSVALPQKSEAQAQNPLETDTVKELDEVEVTAELTPEIYSDISRIILVITPEEISQSPVGSINDLLKNISQIDLRKRGAGDIQGDISIRGGNFSQTLILLNGVNINDPQTGHHNLDLPISLSQIERIEIITGPASRIYGPDAFSGAVNIITKTKEKALTINAKTGNFGLYNISGNIGFGKGNTNHLISISTEGSNGYTQNTDYGKTTGYYGFSSQFKKSILDMQTAFAVKNFGAFNFYTPKFPNQFESTKSGFISIRYRRFGIINTSSIAYFRAHTDRFELFRNMQEAPLWYKNHNYHFTKTAGANLRIYKSYEHGRTSAGINLRFEDIHSNVLGIVTGDTVSAFADPAGFYTKYDNRLTFSAFAEQLIKTGKFRLTAGVMANRFQNDSALLRLFPGVDMSYHLTEKIKLTANINTGMRQPSFTDLYYNGPSNKGNPNLLPESNITAECGFSFKSKFTNGQFTVFISKGKNIIDWVRKADTLKWESMNIGQTTTNGYEFNYNISPAKLLNTGALPQRLSFSLSQNFVNFNTGEYLSRYVDDYLKLHLSVSAAHRLGKKFMLSWTYDFFNRNGSFQDYDYNTGTEITTPYGSHSLFNIKFSYDIKQWIIYAEIINLFNKRYYDYGNVLSPGRWFSVGIRKRFVI